MLTSLNVKNMSGKWMYMESWKEFGWNMENHFCQTVWKILVVLTKSSEFPSKRIQPGTYFLLSKHSFFSFMKKLTWSCCPQNISLFILFPLFINFISTKARPKGLERDRTLRVPVFLTPQTITQIHIEHLWYMQILKIFPSLCCYSCEACLWHFWWCLNHQQNSAKWNMAQCLWFPHTFFSLWLC